MKAVFNTVVIIAQIVLMNCFDKDKEIIGLIANIILILSLIALGEIK